MEGVARGPVTCCCHWWSSLRPHPLLCSRRVPGGHRTIYIDVNLSELPPRNRAKSHTHTQTQYLRVNLLRVGMRSRAVLGAACLLCSCVGASALLVGVRARRITLFQLSRCSCYLQAGLPVSQDSSLAELRSFISERGLDIKTTGKGRTKAVIYDEIIALCSLQDLSSATPEPIAAADANSKAATLSSDDDATIEAGTQSETSEEETELMGRAPDGFEWGGIY